MYSISNWQVLTRISLEDGGYLMADSSSKVVGSEYLPDQTSVCLATNRGDVLLCNIMSNEVRPGFLTDPTYKQHSFFLVAPLLKEEQNDLSSQCSVWLLSTSVRLSVSRAPQALTPLFFAGFTLRSSPTIFHQESMVCLKEKLIKWSSMWVQIEIFKNFETKCFRRLLAIFIFLNHPKPHHPHWLSSGWLVVNLDSSYSPQPQQYSTRNPCFMSEKNVPNSLGHTIFKNNTESDFGFGTIQCR